MSIERFSTEDTVHRTPYNTDNPKSNTKPPVSVVDFHLWDGLQRVSIWLMIIKTANTSKKDNDLPMSIIAN